jgi:hypothetical protein
LLTEREKHLLGHPDFPTPILTLLSRVATIPSTDLRADARAAGTRRTIAPRPGAGQRGEHCTALPARRRANRLTASPERRLSASAATSGEMRGHVPHPLPGDRMRLAKVRRRCRPRKHYSRTTRRKRSGRHELRCDKSDWRNSAARVTARGAGTILAPASPWASSSGYTGLSSQWAQAWDSGQS